MAVPKESRRIVERMFKAMQVGLAAEKEMMVLFDEDAVFTEPFSGEVRTHRGKEAIRVSFVEMWKDPEPDVDLTVGRIDMDGNVVVAHWTCTSPIFPTPMRGHDRFRIKDGLIQHLEVVVTDMPDIEMDEDRGAE